VESVDLLGDRFERPADFDLATYWQASTEAYERDIQRVEITISVEAERVDDFASLAGSRVMESAVRLPDTPGRVRLRASFQWDDEVLAVALRLGAAAEVLEPEWLRAQILATAREVVEHYSVGSMAGVPG
jgi:predicted DNA-binding transcriptional regulator YafY